MYTCGLWCVLTYVHMTCIDVLISDVIQWAQDHTIIIICPLQSRYFSSGGV